MALSSMAQKPEVKFDKLFQKLYNTELWLIAYERIAANQGIMTAGIDGKTADGMGMELVERMISDLKASRYKPNPSRRTYRDKPNGSKRPIGIPSYEDKLLQGVVTLLLEAIYEPIFSTNSHGFRPDRSCHTALEQVKRMNGTRWWVEGDIKGFFDNLHHETLLKILEKRITDNRFLHLIRQFLEAGYIEDWQYHKTYSGTPQGGTLSPLLSNIYLNDLDQMMLKKIAEFNQGKKRRIRNEYSRLCYRRNRAKQTARQTGDWSEFKVLTKQMHRTQAADHFDENFRRMTYVRYADDFLIGIIGSKADATTCKAWLMEYLQNELHLELSQEKTLITNAKDRIQFLGYDIKRWIGDRILRLHTRQGVKTKRTCTNHFVLLIPKDKCDAFARHYGNPHTWKGAHRSELVNLSELEILMTYNAEIRGFLNYYSLAHNLKTLGTNILYLTTGSFMRTLAAKHKSSFKKEAARLKRGPNHYVITAQNKNGKQKEYELLSSTRQLKRERVRWDKVDSKPNVHIYRNRTELGQRLRANQCEWCGTTQGKMVVHHVRKLKDLKGKTLWERRMIERQRKTLVLCHKCHTELHAGKLSEQTRAK